MKPLYTLGIHLYGNAIRIGALQPGKARMWVSGRRSLFQDLEKKLGQKTRKRIWFHCASLGEFEQARPLIEKIDRADHEIVISFFSPSGYEMRKDYPHADAITYLPLDTPSNAIRFLDLVQPDQVIFVKYEFWHHLIEEIYRREIPLYLVSANFRGNQLFFKYYGAFFLKMLLRFTHIYVQNQHSANLLQKKGIKAVTVAGDTRFDRVYENSLVAEEVPYLADFGKDHFVLVAGSSWPEEEKIIAKSLEHLPDNVRVIIAPHQVDAAHIQQLLRLFGEAAVAYSAIPEQGMTGKRVLVIDSIGLLANTYQYADAAFVGGGFRSALHNILEPAVYGIPVMYGPETAKHPEGEKLVQAGGGFKITKAHDFYKLVNELVTAQEFRENTGNAAGNWILNNRGATATILTQINA